MFKIINETNSSQHTINNSQELLNVFEQLLDSKSFLAKTIAKKDKEYIKIINQDKDRWFQALDLLASISGNGGFRLDQLKAAMLNLSDAFYHLD